MMVDGEQAEAAVDAAALTAILAQLDAAEGAAVDVALDSARGLLDALPPDAMDGVAAMLVGWSSDCPAAARRERCRLVSYAAIMHGCGLLGVLPDIMAAMVQRFGAPPDTSRSLGRAAFTFAAPPRRRERRAGERGAAAHGG